MRKGKKQIAPNKRKKGDKANSNPATLELRKMEIAQMLADGFTIQEIIYSLSQSYGVGEQTIKDNLRAVYQEFREQTKDEIEIIRTRLNNMYLNLYKIAKEEGDIALAHKILTTFELFATNKSTTTVNVLNQGEVNFDLSHLTEDQLLEIAEAKKALGLKQFSDK